MAFHIVNQGKKPLGAAFATGLQSELSDVLQGLASQRAQQLQQRSFVDRIRQSAPGISEQQAGLLALVAQTDPKSFFPALQATDIGQQQGVEQFGVPSQPEAQETQVSPAQQKTLQNYLQNKQITPDQQERLKEHFARQEPQQTPAQQQIAGQPQAKKLFGETPKDRQVRKKQEQKEKAEAFKFSKDLISTSTQGAKEARDSLRDLERLEDLEKEGLGTSGYNELLKRSGLDISSLREPASEEFQKIVANFQRNAKAMYGARISNFELESFLRTLPNLSQSPEGRKRVIANLKNINRMAIEYGKAVKDVIRENNNIPPYDLELQVDDRIDKVADKLAGEFKKDLAKPVPKTQKGWKTTGQAIAGSALGAPGTLLGGIGNLLSKLA